MCGNSGVSANIHGGLLSVAVIIQLGTVATPSGLSCENPGKGNKLLIFFCWVRGHSL